MSDSLFESSHAALRFAYGQRGPTCDRPTVSRMAAPAGGTGRGLGGLDGSAQAGMIRQEVKAFGRLDEALLIGRHGPQHSPCECGSPCCSGRRPNREWVEAVLFLADHMRETALANCTTTSLQRVAYVSRYFTPKGLRDSVESLAERFDRDRTTISSHYGRVSKLLGGTEARKNKPAEPGMEDLARQLADDRFRVLGWVGESAA